MQVHTSLTNYPQLEQSVLQYYATVIASKNAPVEVKYVSPQKGKGLFATRSFEKDQVLFTEKPLIAAQDLDNRGTVWTCANCFRFIGTLEDQFLHLKTVILQMESKMSQQDFTKLMSKAISCKGGCGESYCSDQCRGEAFNKHHRLLCVGPIQDERHPLVLFKQHAVINNELFLLAAQVIANIICEWQMNGRDFQKAIMDYNVYPKAPYVSIVGTEPGIIESVQKMVNESIFYLKSALLPYVDQYLKESGSPNATTERAYITQILTPEFYSLLLGLLETNDNGIEIINPLQKILEQLESMPLQAKETAWKHLEPLVAEIIKRDEEYEDDEDDMDDSDEKQEGQQTLYQKAMSKKYIFSPFAGLGMFRLSGVGNHSCIPNTIVKFNEDNNLQLVALRHIEPGEELTHSYIEDSLPLEDRREDLRSYGFVCDCPKCLAEEKEQLNK